MSEPTIASQLAEVIVLILGAGGIGGYATHKVKERKANGNGNGVKPLGETGVELAIMKHEKACQLHMTEEFDKVKSAVNNVEKKIDRLLDRD